MKRLREVYIRKRFFIVCSVLAFLFVLGFFLEPFFFIAKVLLLFFLILIVIDISLLFLLQDQIILFRRDLPDRFSNGDQNEVTIYLKNIHRLNLHITLIDEIPEQFQIRDFAMKLFLKPQEEKKLRYDLKPVRRGEYEFGITNTYISTFLQLFDRRLKLGEQHVVKVYPSFLKMRQYELLAISNRLTEVGIKRVQKIGTYSEFDQIKEYVSGDNYRTINWKATAKRARLMVNQYQEERSQQVYSLLDLGRVMMMPFEGMSLLDYAINSSLIISNTALYKHDKAGLLTFNNTIGNFLPAERRNKTLLNILEALYNTQTRYLESDFALLTSYVKRHITHRSFLILYSNFESLSSLGRDIIYLKHLAQNHLVLVVLFENTEIRNLLSVSSEKVRDIYTKTIAEKFIHDKKLIVKELKKHGIMALLTKPKSLTTNLINKYLELKNTGML